MSELSTITPQMIRDTAAWSQSEDDLRDTLKQAAEALDRLTKALETAREALEPFAAMIERSDALDRAWLAENAPGMDIESYTPSSDKIFSSGEMRNPVYVTRGQFRAAAAAIRAIKEGR